MPPSHIHLGTFPSPTSQYIHLSNFTILSTMENYYSVQSSSTGFETFCFQDDSFFHQLDHFSFELDYNHKEVPAVQSCSWTWGQLYASLDISPIQDLEKEFSRLEGNGPEKYGGDNTQVVVYDKCGKDDEAQEQQISSEVIARFEFDYCQREVPVPGCFLELDPLYESLDIVPTQGGREEFVSSLDGNAAENFGVENQQVVVYDKHGKDLVKEEKKTSISGDLTRATIARYFYMPITEAAKEMNIGLTLLKKRCREVGIPRWPHRKLMSLQSLIKNVQEMELQEEVDKSFSRGVIELLQEQMKLIEEMPEIDLEEKTKKLRQACFKMNYKKRKQMQMLEWPSSPSCSYGSMGSIDPSTSAALKNVRMKMEQL